MQQGAFIFDTTYYVNHNIKGHRALQGLYLEAHDTTAEAPPPPPPPKNCP
jgi:hypothetical protein